MTRTARGRVRTAGVVSLAVALAMLGCRHLPSADDLAPPIPPGAIVPVDGLDINYRLLEATEPAAAARPVVVMLHGFGASSVTWLDVEDELRRVALRTLFTLRDSVTDVAVHRLVLLDAASYDQTMPFFIRQLTNPIGRFIAFTFMSPAMRVRYTMERIMRAPGAVTARRVARYAYFNALPGSEHALVATAERMLPPDHEEFVARFPSIRQPTLIIWGTNDPVIPTGHALRLHADIPDSELVVLSLTGHVPHEERPGEVARRIAEFLR